MGRLVWAGILLWGILSNAHADEGAPGFNCQDAVNAAEKLICGESSLATADRRLNAVYAELRSALSAEEREQLRAEQHLWMKGRDQACDWSADNRNLTTSCLLRYYRHRQQTMEWRLHPEKAPGPQRPLRIERMTPSGEDVGTVSEIVFQFNQPVVPIGDMLRDANEIPVKITPDSPEFDCRWRWLNSSALACNLASRVHLSPATRYDFLFDPIRAESGAEMSEPFTGFFSAGRPKVRQVSASTWLDARHPVLRMHFNMSVTAASVVNAIRIDASGPVEYVLLPGDYDDWAALPERLAASGNDPAMMFFPDDEASATWWYLAPVRPIPPGTDGYVVTEHAGLKHPVGNLAGEAEGREVARIEAYPPFQFIALRCASYERNREGLSWEELRDGAGPVCAPDNRLAVTFSSPITDPQIIDHIFLEKIGSAEAIRFEASEVYRKDGFVQGAPQSFTMRAEHAMEPASQYRLVVKNEILDIFGRPLSNAFQGTFETTNRMPRLEYRQGNIVLESGRNTDAFVQTRNVGSFYIRGNRKTHDNQSSDFTKIIETPGIDNERYGIPLNLRGLLGDEYTWMRACLRWNRSSLPYPFEVPRSGVSLHHDDSCFSVQVTPFHVHAKTGRLNTMIWVTDLETGNPVDGARVEANMGDGKPSLFATTDAQGRALFERRPYFVWVHKGDAAAQLNLDYGYFVPNDQDHGQGMPSHSIWGFTPQGVYQAGDEVAVKGYYRQRDGEEWVTPEEDYLSLRVTDPRGQQVHRVARADLSRFGTFSINFVLPDAAASGTYIVFARRHYLDSKGRAAAQDVGQVAQFVVSDFNPVEIEVDTEILGSDFRPGDTLRYRVNSNFMSGGGYANARARITGRLILQKTVRAAQGMEGFQFPAVPDEQRTVRLFERDVRLNENGEFEGEVRLNTQTATQGDVVVDASVMDERGQQIAAHSRAPFSGRDAFPGLKVPWSGYQQGQESAVEVIVIDGQGRALAGRNVAVTIERAVISGIRVKAADESYEMQDHVDWEVIEQCTISSAVTAQICKFIPDAPGEIRVVAALEGGGSMGISHQITTLVQGDGDVLWSERSGNSLQISPRQESVEVGETAAYLVRNPFPGSRALITVEREGVIDSFVKEFDSSVEKIEFPVTAEHVPGYFLSVVVAAPRVGDDAPVGDVDLGQPTYASGYVRTIVPSEPDRLHLTVTPQKESYAPGDEARVSLLLDDKSQVSPEDVEVAVLVIDEGVLALNRWGISYYDLYKNWHHLYGLNVANYNLLTRLSNKLIYEGKGTTLGGDGADGSDGPALSFREDFKYLVHWEPALSLDGNGQAEFSFDLPDNLTRWRVIAIASDSGQRAGLADNSFVTENPTEIRAAFPNQVTTGDEFVARFTVMNRTNRTRELNIDWKMTGPVKDKSDVPVTTLTLEPYQRKIIDRPLVAEKDGVIEFTVSIGDDEHRDGLRHSLNVLPVRNQEVAASYASVDDDEASETLLPPHDMDPRLSRAETAVLPTMLGVGAGALRYLTAYEHNSWENMLSRGLGYALSEDFAPWMQEPVTRAHSEAEVQSMLRAASRFQLDDGGMAFWPHGSNRYSHPFLSIYTLVVFDKLRSNGYTPPEMVERKVRDYLRGLLRQDSGFHGEFSGQARLSLRAQIVRVLASAGDASHADLASLEPHLGDMDLTALSGYLHAQVLLKADQGGIGNTIDRILAHLRQDAGTVYFEGQAYGYNLGSILKTQCEVLSALVAAERSAPGQHALDEIPYRMMRFITQGRDGKDHWLNTQENAYCLMAVQNYADVYESEDPNAVIQVVYGNEPLGSVELTQRSQSASVFDIEGARLVPGVAEPVRYQRVGKGRFYHATRMYFTRTGSSPEHIDAGISARRSYSVLRQGQWKNMDDSAVLERGDVVRVRLDIEVDVPRNFVVVDDPVPGAFEPVSMDLATAKGFGGADVGVNIQQFPEGYSSYQSGPYRQGFVYHNMAHDAVRFYADYLPEGRYSLSYTMQVVAAGNFHAHPVKASEMYNPETFGIGRYRRVRVRE